MISDILAYRNHKQDDNAFSRASRHIIAEYFMPELSVSLLPLFYGRGMPSEQKEIADRLIETRLLRWDAASSSYMHNVKLMLLRCGFPVLHRPFQLPVLNPHGKGGGRIGVYTPDFLLPYHYVNGKGIVIEAHDVDNITFDHLERLRNARNMYDLYVVIVAYGDIDLRWPDSERAFRFVDQFWCMPENGRRYSSFMRNIKLLLRNAEMSEVSTVELLLERLLKLETGNVPQLIRA